MLLKLIKTYAGPVWSMQETHFNGLFYAILVLRILLEYVYNPGPLDYTRQSHRASKMLSKSQTHT